jgi:hypothetical protein
MKVWSGTATVPPDYPTGLPFVPNAEVGIEEKGDAVLMKWWALQRPLELMQQLLGASVQDGWQLTSEEPQPTGDAGSMRRMVFQRDGLERIIEALQAAQFSFVTLTQRPAE